MYTLYVHTLFLAHDAFVRMNRRAIAMMFVRLSVCLGWVYCDHMVHVSVVSSLWLDSRVLGTLTPKHVHLLQSFFFHFHPEASWGMDVQTRRDISRTVGR